jgi:Fe2+ transport system protein FeoA
MRCPMCRVSFDPSSGIHACQSCPFYHLARGCRLRLIRCPRCGYHSLPTEETISSPVPSALQASAMKDCGAACLLAELGVGAQGRVVGFDSLNERELQRLMAYGLVPGVRLKILQHVPATILKIHQTELALEHTLAKAIYVVSDHHSASS